MSKTNFKFNKYKNKFSWENPIMKLEFSNPSIQSFNEYVPLDNEKGIMYYYYTVKVFKKVTKYNRKSDKEFTKLICVSERHAFDFPCIQQLKCILEYQLKNDARKDGQKTTYSDESIRYSKTLCTEGFACDDFYEITKDVDDNGKGERYTVYCGSAIDRQGDLNSVGIRLVYISRQEIIELLKCVNAFIKYSIQIHNKSIDNYKKAYEIIGNKIYEFDGNCKKVAMILAIGDLADITTVVNRKQEEQEQIIKDISGDTVILEDGSTHKIYNIVYLNREYSKEELYYNRQQIAEDFLKILSNEEKIEFKEKDIDALVEKYGIAIMDRTAMCREEHGFNCRKSGVSPTVAIIPVIRDVVEIIKTLF